MGLPHHAQRSVRLPLRPRAGPPRFPAPSPLARGSWTRLWPSTKKPPAVPAVRHDGWFCGSGNRLSSDARVTPGVGRRDQRPESALTSCRSAKGDRWVISAWEPCHLTWANPPCPCMHSDPKFPDCAPGETKRVHGLLSFYEGDDINAEFRRLDALRAPTYSRESTPSPTLADRGGS